MRNLRNALISGRLRYVFSLDKIGKVLRKSSLFCRAGQTVKNFFPD
jgi:hypothetical protein